MDTAPNPRPSNPMPQNRPPSSGHKNKLYVIIAATVVIIIALVFVIIGLVANKGATSESAISQDQKLIAANTVTATMPNSFLAVCKTGAVSNATDYKKPYVIAAFNENNFDNNWTLTSIADGPNYKVATSDNFTDTNAVVCLSRKADTAVKSMSCNYGTSTAPDEVDYYAVQYLVSLYEAKTGKFIKDLGTVPGPATKCPSFVAYSKTDPKLYGSPEVNSLYPLLDEFFAE